MSALAFLAMLVALGAATGVVRYRTPINPLTAFCVIDAGIFIVGSGFVASALDPFTQLTHSGVRATAIVSAFFILGAIIPHLFRGSIPARIFAIIVSAFGLTSTGFARRFSLVKLLVILAAAFGSFAALAFVGGGGLLWITDSRTAYQFYRTGAGPFFALTHWLFVFGLLYTLWSRRPRTLAIAGWTLLFVLPILFLGSKTYILVPILVSVFYRHFIVARIPPFALATAASFILALPLGLQLVQGTADDTLGTLLYFRDYFATSAEFLQRFDELGLRYGTAFASQAWFFVPRILYPAKPFEYGLTLVHGTLFPGLAEQTHTAGALPWTLAYLDFGIVGAFAAGCLSGLWRRAAFEYFLSHRESFFAFVLMCHFALVPVWHFAPLPLLLTLLVLQSLFLRLRLVTLHDRSSAADSRLRV